jgi:hypothetical protein
MFAMGLNLKFSRATKSRFDGTKRSASTGLKFLGEDYD